MKRGITAPEDEVSGSASLITRITRSNSDQTYVSPKDKEDPLGQRIYKKALQTTAYFINKYCMEALKIPSIIF